MQAFLPQLSKFHSDVDATNFEQIKRAIRSIVDSREIESLRSTLKYYPDEFLELLLECDTVPKVKDVRESGEIILLSGFYKNKRLGGRIGDMYGLKQAGQGWTHWGRGIRGLPPHMRILQGYGPYILFYEYIERLPLRHDRQPPPFVYVYNVDTCELKTYEYLDHLRDDHGQILDHKLHGYNLKFKLQQNGVPVIDTNGSFIDLDTKIEHIPNLPHAYVFHLCLGDRLVFFFNGTQAYIVDRRNMHVLEKRYIEPYGDSYPMYYSKGVLYTLYGTGARVDWKLNEQNIQRLLLVAWSKPNVPVEIWRKISTYLCYE